MNHDRLQRQLSTIFSRGFARKTNGLTLLAVILNLAVGCGQGYVKQTEKFAASVKRASEKS